MSIRQLLLASLMSSEQRTVIQELDGESFLLSEFEQNVHLMEQSLKRYINDPRKTIIGVAMRSGYDWVTCMMTSLKLNTVLLPVPLEFSDEQIVSLLDKASLVVVNDYDVEKRLSTLLPEKLLVNMKGVPLTAKPSQPVSIALPEDVISIIHTSGTTSSPKGVMIRDNALSSLVKALFTRIPTEPLSYLSVVPMSLLIEQVVGFIIPFLSGGRTIFMPVGMAEFGVGVEQSNEYINLFRKAEPNFGYLPPQLLTCLLERLETESKEQILGINDPHFVTGGTNVSETLLHALTDKNIKVFEGYGLSENSSVVSLNSPGMNRIGSVGKPLPGVNCRVVEGELRVKSSTLCAGYYSSDDSSCEIENGELFTGDLAEIQDGYLYIKGRKKHVIILANARNVSPEWVEKNYRKMPSVDDVIVVGDGNNHLSAVIFTQRNIECIREEQKKLQDLLPHFAVVRDCILVKNYDEFRAEYYTVTGRPIRKKIEDFLNQAQHREYVA